MHEMPVTNARGGQSYHNFGLAFDIALIKKEKPGKAVYDLSIDLDKDGVKDWSEIVACATAFGWQWGGSWKHPDYPHFEYSFGFPVSALDERMRLGLVEEDNYPMILAA